MRKKLLVIMTLLITSFLLGCQESKVEEKKEISTRIEIVDWETKEPAAILTDGEYIERLIDLLDHAESVSTAYVDLLSPSYSLKIIQNDKTVYDLLYYEDEITLDGIDGKYLNANFKNEKMYGVTLELPKE